MKADPYNLDCTHFGEVVRAMQAAPCNEEVVDEPAHPLRTDPHVTALCHHLEQTELELLSERYPDDSINDDAYFYFEEGFVLRREVIARMVIDYIRKNPQVIQVT